jgi:hypothetical protein
MNPAWPETLISASGFGVTKPFRIERVADVAAGALARSEAPIRLARSKDTLEAGAAMGPMARSAIAGNYLGNQWACVAFPGEEGLLHSCSSLVARRAAEPVNLPDTGDLMSYFSAQRAAGLKALCIVGRRLPWRTQESLQMAGAVIGRLPLATPDSMEELSERISNRDRSQEPLPKRAWILAGPSDHFTDTLTSLFSEALSRRFRAHGFEVDVAAGASERSKASNTSSQLPGFVVLLTHGGDSPIPGLPLGLDPNTLANIRRACASGALLLHLGCNGAGMFAGGRFEDIPEQLGLEVPKSEEDTFDTFASECLAAGSCGVIAHVDSTWSSAFSNPESVLDLVDWIASGRGSLGHAMDSIWTDALRAGVDAHNFLREGNSRSAGLSWLRHLDLKGFVLLGDPSTYLCWA